MLPEFFYARKTWKTGLPVILTVTLFAATAFSLLSAEGIQNRSLTRIFAVISFISLITTVISCKNDR